jgi:hypothetical protein
MANAVAEEIVLFATPPAGATLATIVEHAVPPRDPSSPTPLLVAALVAALGVGLASLAAVAYERRREPSQRRIELLRRLEGTSRAGAEQGS